MVNGRKTSFVLDQGSNELFEISMKLTAMNAKSHYSWNHEWFRAFFASHHGLRAIALLMAAVYVFITSGDVLAAQRLSESAKALDQAGFALMKRESLGPLRLGMSELAILSALKAKPVKGKMTLWEADGTYHQEWRYPKLGLILDLSSEKRSGAKNLFSITAQAPCRLKTSRSIQIGGSENEALAAYGAEYNKEYSDPGISIVAGSPYGGVTFFIVNHRIFKLFIGATAE
jgi:hypothetical protein